MVLGRYLMVGCLDLPEQSGLWNLWVYRKLQTSQSQTIQRKADTLYSKLHTYMFMYSDNVDTYVHMHTSVREKCTYTYIHIRIYIDTYMFCTCIYVHMYIMCLYFVYKYICMLSI